MTRTFSIACCAALLLSRLALAAAAEPPDVLVRDTSERVLEIIRTDPAIIAGDKERISEVVESYLIPHFDFVGMTRLALGKNWRQIDPEKRPALVREFQTLLVRTYSTALTEYRDQKIEYKPLTLAADARRAVVETMISQQGAQPIAMNYRMALTADGWKVYDVIVEGVSLVINYRSLFDSTVESSGVDGLIKLLQDKNQQTS